MNEIIKQKIPEFYLEYHYYVDNNPIWKSKKPFDIHIKFTFKEKLKFWFGKHNKKKFECWAIDRLGMGCLLEVNLIKNIATYKGKKRRFY